MSMRHALHRTMAPRQGATREKAFTLVELLVVIAVMALLMAMAGLTVPASMATQQLGGMARQLAADLDHAVLLAQKESVPVEVRFYRYPEKEGLGGEEYRAYQIAKITGWASDGKPKLQFTTEAQKLTGGVIMMGDPQYSTLLSKTPVKSGPDDADLGMAYEYVSYLIRPDGRTNLPRDAKTVFTLVREMPEGSPTDLPADYRSIVLDPVTGSVVLY